MSSNDDIAIADARFATHDDMETALANVAHPIATNNNNYWHIRAAQQYEDERPYKFGRFYIGVIDYDNLILYARRSVE